MKTKFLFIIVASVILVGCTFPVKKQKVQSMFITHSSYANFDIENIIEPNAALLVVDKNEIGNAQQFFLSERRNYYLCGYDYEALFWFNSDSLYNTVCLNSECEDFAYRPMKSQELLNRYVKLLETNPSHYIYDMEIPVSFDLKYIKKELRDNGLIVFSFANESERFPSLTFSYKNFRYVGKNSSDKEWKIAEQENKNESQRLIMEIIDKIKDVSKVINTPTITYPYPYGHANDNIYHKVIVRLFFENENALNLAENILHQTEAEINEITVPDTYTLQLIDTTNDIEIIKQKLQQYKYITKVSKYLENYTER